jgi:uncharacterized Zn finger protein (UPF0148 family)
MAYRRPEPPEPEQECPECGADLHLNFFGRLACPFCEPAEEYDDSEVCEDQSDD